MKNDNLVMSSLKELMEIEEARQIRELELEEAARAQMAAKLAEEKERADALKARRQEELLAQNAERSVREREETALWLSQLERRRRLAILASGVPTELRQIFQDLPEILETIARNLSQMAELHQKTTATQGEIFLSFLETLPEKTRQEALRNWATLADGKLFKYFPNEMRLLSDCLWKFVRLLRPEP
ncbi:hypothetical protein HYT45_01430 [Candidatus Uhrbacteria bacterium]|nr:hypothetical protein [Candidatus Uhrbacteria bacterium]